MACARSIRSPVVGSGVGLTSISNTHPTFNSFQPSPRILTMPPSRPTPRSCGWQTSPATISARGGRAVATARWAASTAWPRAPQTLSRRQTLLVEIGIWPTRSKISAASSNSTKALNQTAYLATCSLQCPSQISSCSSRGEKPALAGLTVVITAFQGQLPYPALDGIGLAVLIVHLTPAGRTTRSRHRPHRRLRFNDRQRHPFTQPLAQL